MFRARALLVVATLTALAACSFRNVGCGMSAPADSTATATATPVASGSGGSGGGGGAASGVEIVFLGDSLTAGYGLLETQSFPALIQKRFAAEGYTVEPVNAGVTGDTTAGALRRVEQALTPSTRILVVALGGNDALRGLTVAQTHDNIAGIIDVALTREVMVLLCGMEAPTNLGEDYRESFRESFTRLLREYKGRISFVPFLLEGVAGNPTLNQPDGIHPNVQGAGVVADLLYPKLRAMVDRLQ